MAAPHPGLAAAPERGGNLRQLCRFAAQRQCWHRLTVAEQKSSRRLTDPVQRGGQDAKHFLQGSGSNGQ